jgi:transcriptional regulator with XRE-family HTH domain
MAKCERCYLEIGRLIRSRRELRGLSQATLSESVGWSRGHLAHVEAGKYRVQLHQLPKLARALRIRVRELLPREFTK